MADPRRLVSHGASWWRRGVVTETGTPDADQLLLIEAGSLSLGDREVPAGALIVTPAGCGDQVTVKTWSMTATDVDIETSSVSPVAAGIYEALSWRRALVDYGDAFTLDGPSTFLLAVLSGAVVMTCAGPAERASREVLVISSSSTLTRVEAAGPAEVLTIELPAMWSLGRS